MWQDEFVAALRDPTRPPAITDDARRAGRRETNLRPGHGTRGSRRPPE